MKVWRSLMKFGPHKFKWFNGNRLLHYIHSYLSWDEEVGGTCSQTDSKTLGWNHEFAERTPHGVKNGLSVQYHNIWTLMINVWLLSTSISIVLKYLRIVILKKKKILTSIHVDKKILTWKLFEANWMLILCG